MTTLVGAAAVGPTGATGATGPGATLEAWRAVGAGGQPAFANSWVNYGGAERPAEFAKDSLGNVYIRGIIKSGSVGATAFTLPSGYRPSKSEYIPVMSYNGSVFSLAFLTVNTDGTVVPTSGANNGFYMTGAFFSTT